ncbi:DUF3103 family protein [Catellatospora citrea]|uniref:DUF3103 family protein n=1 Tax=Catellatospora citrea TaxID=53366 RepID=A0A8J3KHF9_9ACTN|nr:DUF3103 family protein [Catellatospora citrea]RKE12830.1 hypothetical protein C8E86_7775 [Catellatospora citrea]GIF95929.1 hypothetical protein Cci01nite_10230 [Catellatospora citrea]
MRPARLRHLVLPACIAAAAVLAAAPATAQIPQQAAPARAVAPAGVASTLDTLARQVAASLTDPAARRTLVSAVRSGPVDLSALRADSTLAGRVRTADQAVHAAKGLPAATGSLVRARLADDGMAAALAAGAVPLVAAAPGDDDAAAIVAYEPDGRRVLLDPIRVPSRPVIVVEVDVAKALPAGLDILRQALAQRGVAPAAAALASGGYWATKVNAVRLSDDQEPWIKGAAEIYSIVSGFGLDGTPKVDIVQMPYLDHDGTTYYPNQLLVHFSAYKYNLADVVMMEDDGDTNYQQLAQAIAAVLLTIADVGAYIPLVDAILSAIPTSWWTDDPDFVDAWYTLSTGSSGHLNGAGAHGWLEVSPYWVAPL